MGSLEPTTSLLSHRAPSPPLSQVFHTRAASADYLRPRIPSPIGNDSCAWTSAHPRPPAPCKGYTCSLELSVLFMGILEEFEKKKLAYNVYIYYTFFRVWWGHKYGIVYYPAALLDKCTHVIVLFCFFT